MTRCPQCGQENRTEARFCDACGGSLVATAVIREERKVVSVLFADLVDFTASVEGRDPEDVRAVQDPYWQYVRAAIEGHGGTVEKFIGDAVVGLFGAPSAHEDDPERAVRAALAIREWAEEHEGVKVRIAVTTGEALVRLGARPLAGEGMASGDVINTASRLQAKAPANGIVVDEATCRATSQVIDYRESEPVSAKGKAEPVAIWEVVQARSRFGVDVISHGRTRLVGRARELELIRATLSRVRAERAPQLLTIVGVPGVGKSRLVYELMQTVAADPSEIVTWRQGRSLAYGDGVTFWALAEIVKAEAGVLETDTDEAVRGKVLHAVRQVIDDEVEADWVARHLQPLVGLGGDGQVLGKYDAEALAAWRRFFELLAEWRPLVLVFEDLHWADDGLLDFVDGLGEWVLDVPLLVIATARPELLERRPNWGGGKANSATLSLSALSETDTAQLVSTLLEESVVSPDLNALLSARAGGNALYAEQYVRMLGERGYSEELPMPETVHGVIAARLDALPQSEKALLHEAAIFGKVFWGGAVLAPDGIDGDRVAESLRSLERKEFIHRARRSSVAGENEYSFRHVLFRDVAYGQIPRSVRADKHGRAAAWIESLGRPDDHAEMLAHHYLTAFQLTRATGEDATQLVEPTRASLVRAGDRALSVNAPTAAASYFKDALEFWSKTDEKRAPALWGYGRALFMSGDDACEEVLERARAATYDLGDVEVAAEADAMLASLAWDRGQRQDVDAHLDRALSIMRDRPPSPAKARVLGAVARFRMLSYEDWPGAIAAARDALSLAEALDLAELRADTLVTLGTAHWFSGDRSGAAEIEEGHRLALAHSALSAASRAINNLGTVAWEQGDFSKWKDLVVEARELQTKLGRRGQTRFYEGQFITASYLEGFWDDAWRLAASFIAECEGGSAHRSEPVARIARASISFARDDTDAAWAECEKVLALARQARDPQWLAGFLADVMELDAKAGRFDEARSLGQEILSLGPVAAGTYVSLARVTELAGLEPHEVRSFGKGLPENNVWRRLGDIVLAGELERAADSYARMKVRVLEAETRLLAAKALLNERRLDGANAQLDQALTFFRSVAATRFIREVEELQAAISHEKEDAAQAQA